MGIKKSVVNSLISIIFTNFAVRKRITAKIQIKLFKD